MWPPPAITRSGGGIERFDEDLELRACMRRILDEEFRRLPRERGADGAAAGEADVGGYGLLGEP